MTILNCLLWVLVLIGFLTDREPLMVLALLLCWPLAWLFILSTLSPPSPEALGLACVMIGVNSLLWGYGISWLISLLEKGRAANHPSRGFEVVPTKAAAWETGPNGASEPAIPSETQP